MSPRTRVLVTLAATGAAVLVTPAQAAVVEVRHDPSLETRVCGGGPEDCPRVMLAVRADPGERNILTLVRDGDDVVVADLGAHLRVGAGCSAVAGGARCPRPIGPFHDGARVTVDAGDGNDRVIAPDVTLGSGDVYVGGDGNDFIAAPGRIVGGAGQDSLTGVGVAVVVEGGEGDDQLRAIDTPLRLPRLSDLNDVELNGGAGEDDIRGGRGATYIHGGTGADRIRAGTGNSWIYGGPGDDRIDGGATHAFIRGDDGNDLIAGGPWSDRLHGGPGADRIAAGYGFDDVWGEGGDDRIHTIDGLRDRVDCGLGGDRLTADRIDRRSVCERFEARGHRAPPPDAQSG